MSAALGARWALATLVVAGCEGGTKEPPSLHALRQPSGLAMSPDGRWLLVTGGNWDQAEDGGTLLSFDLQRMHAGLADPLGPRSATSEARPCRLAGAVSQCNPAALVGPGVVVGDGIGDVVLDPLSGEPNRWRLLVIQRRPPAIVWIDGTQSGDDLQLQCGQGEGDRCDAFHQLTRARDEASRVLPIDPSRIVIDEQGYRFAYVPHLVEGQLSLIDLDGEFGPDISAVQEEFFRPAVFEDLEIRGGFSVAARACDPADPPRASLDCSRPVLYSTHRFWPGARKFTVAPGLEIILPGQDAELYPVGIEHVESRPLMGDLQFEDPSTGESLLMVQTTPGALARVAIEVTEEGSLRETLQSTVPLCSNPNVLSVYRPEQGEHLALVSCFGDGRLSVVGLGSFQVLQTIQLGEGANEIEVDAPRRVAYVANTSEHTVSVVDLDPSRTTYLTEIGRLGLRADR